MREDAAQPSRQARTTASVREGQHARNKVSHQPLALSVIGLLTTVPETAQEVKQRGPIVTASRQVRKVHLAGGPDTSPPRTWLLRCTLASGIRRAYRDHSKLLEETTLPQCEQEARHVMQAVVGLAGKNARIIFKTSREAQVYHSCLCMSAHGIDS